MVGGVLLGVECFQQGAGRIAFIVRSNLVDFVEHYHGIAGAGLCDGVQDTARKCAYVGFTVAADFGFVVQAAERDALVFAAQSPCDALAEAGFTHARRAVEAEYGRFHVALELEHGEVFYDTVFHRVQPVVVFVQNFLGVLQVQVVLAHLFPGKGEHEVQIIVLHAVVRRVGGVFLEPVKLFVEGLGYFLGPFFLFRTLLELVVVFAFVHTELFLDGLELAVEVVFPLLLVDFGLDLLVDVLLDLGELYLHIQQAQELHGAGAHVVVLKEVDFVGKIVHFHGSGDEVHQEPEVGDAAYGGDGFARGHAGVAHYLDGVFLERIRNCLDGGGILLGKEVVQIMDAGGHERLVVQHGVQRETLDTLQDNGEGAVRHFQALDYLGGCSVGVEVLFLGVLYGHIGLRHAAHEKIALLGLVNEAYALFPAYGDGEDRTGEENGIAKRQDRQGFGELGIADLLQILSLHHWDDVYFRSGGHVV